MAQTPTLLIEAEGKPSQVLVSVYLRGGADGLHLVPPVGDDDYHKLRPTLAMKEKDTLPLEGVFRLHNNLAPLHPFFEQKQLAIIHQAGTPENSRSHFEAEDYLHFGGASGGGWLGKFLHLTKQSNAGPLTAVSISEHISDSLHGTAAVAMRSLTEFALPKQTEVFQQQLGKLYQLTGGKLGQAGSETLAAVQRIQGLSVALQDEEARRKGQPKQARDEFVDGLGLIARLIQANLGLRAATIDLGGWDSHFGAAVLLNSLMPRLAKGLADFATALGKDFPRVTIVVMTEFGRRVGENASLGTDHGRGGVHWVMGGSVPGGKVFADWKGLGGSILEYPGDVPVVHDYRGTLGAVCRHLEPAVDLGKLFPSYEGGVLPIYA